MEQHADRAVPLVVNFMAFLRTGNFGNLVLGATGQQIQALLGPPDDTSLSGKPRIWKYGCLELALLRGELVSIGLGNSFEFVRLSSHHAFALEGRIAQPGATLGAFKGLLDDEGIGHAVCARWTNDRQIALDVGEGPVNPFFEQDRQGTFKLYKFFRSRL